jgi:hypothetical protein
MFGVRTVTAKLVRAAKAVDFEGPWPLKTDPDADLERTETGERWKGGRHLATIDPSA